MLATRLVLPLLLTSIASLAAHEVGKEMASAAGELLGSLSAEQRARATLPFASDERLNWKFVPAERLGLPLDAMSDRQRALTRGLLASALSAEGTLKAERIRDLESVLAEIEKGKGPRRDPLRYFVTIFGTPGPKGSWAWRFEGHHLEVQVTLVDGEVVGLTPQFMGANPGKVADGPRAGLETLSDEDALGRELAASLTPEQAGLAIIPGKVPGDILSGASREAMAIEPMGIPLSRLDPGQRERLWTVIGRFVGRYRGELAGPVLAELRALPADAIWFAWCGSTKVGEGHYYRIQAPGVLMELDNTQNKANHVHTVWRDLRHDFGRDALRRHLETEHAGR